MPWGTRMQGSGGATQQRVERRGQNRDAHMGCRVGPLEILEGSMCGGPWAGRGGGTGRREGRQLEGWRRSGRQVVNGDWPREPGPG